MVFCIFKAIPVAALSIHWEINFFLEVMAEYCHLVAMTFLMAVSGADIVISDLKLLYIHMFGSANSVKALASSFASTRYLLICGCYDECKHMHSKQEVS